MTCEEKLRLEHPDTVNECSYGPTHKCPSDFGYLDRPDWCGNELSSDNCQRCWDREIPEEQTNNKGEPMTDFKDVGCETCVHNKVCMYKDQFAAAKKAVNDVTVYLDTERMIQLRDIPWITAAILCCENYMEEN